MTEINSFYFEKVTAGGHDDNKWKFETWKIILYMFGKSRQKS